MKISRELLTKAVKEKIVTSKQAESLFQFLKDQAHDSPSFNLTNIIYYFGGLIAIGAMTLFMNLGWESFGGWGIFILSILYGILGLGFAAVFKKKNLVVPAGIFATFVICLTPLAIYGLQNAMGWWPEDSSVYREYHYFIKWNWVFMELGTLAVGIILAWIYKYPFMVMPIAVTLWYMSMDIAAMIGQEEYLNFELRSLVSIYFGLLIVLLAFWVDVRSRNTKDYAFWLYIFGVMAFWSGLSCQDSGNELSRFFYFCINLLMIGVGVLLVRKVFVIFGAIGCAFYLGHLAWQVFADSPFFPIALTAIGILIVFIGTLWQKNERRLTQKIQSFLPKSLRETLNSRE